MHVDYTAADTKVYLHINPFTVMIPSWVMLSVLTRTDVDCVFSLSVAIIASP